MAEILADQNAFWTAAGVGMAILGGIGTIFFYVFGRIDAVESAVDDADRDIRKDFTAADAALWSALNNDRLNLQQHREAIIERVAALPTKDDFEKMENRIMRALGAQK